MNTSTSTEETGKSLIGKIVRIVAKQEDLLFYKTGDLCEVFQFDEGDDDLGLPYLLKRDVDNLTEWAKRSDFELINNK